MIIRDATHDSKAWEYLGELKTGEWLRRQYPKSRYPDEERAKAAFVALCEAREADVKQPIEGVKDKQAAIREGAVVLEDLAPAPERWTPPEPGAGEETGEHGPEV